MEKNILILEDDTAQLAKLEKLVINTSSDLNVLCCKNYREAFNSIKMHDSFIFFILDIDLGDNPDSKDGLDFARYIRLRPEYEFTPILYITGVSDRLEEALTTTHCYEYIKKPYDDNSVKEAVIKMLRFPSSGPQKLDIQGINGIRIRIETEKIAYIESIGHELILHTENGIQLTKSYSIKSMEALLPDHFLRCHKSYIINMRYYTGFDISNSTVHLSGYKELIPVGRKYHNNLISIIKPDC